MITNSLENGQGFGMHKFPKFAATFMQSVNERYDSLCHSSYYLINLFKENLSKAFIK